MNVVATANVCDASRARAPLLIGLSTDYVFDGCKAAPYEETDEPRPLSVYGRTKLEAERLVRAYPRGVVVRLSMLFGPGRSNFCSAMIERARRGQPVEAYVDQASSPSYTEDVAEGLDALLGVLKERPVRDPVPVYHIANAGGCRRVEFASRVMTLLGYGPSLVRPIRMAQHQRPAPRPGYSVLSCQSMHAMTGRQLRPWDEALQAYLRHPQ